MKLQKRSKISKRKWLIIGVAVVVIVSAGSWLVYAKFSKQPVYTYQGSINYGPQTEDEKKATQQFKENQQKESSQPTPPPAQTPEGKVLVTPVISYAGQYDNAIEVSAFVPSVFEDGGTCTLTLTQGTSTVTKISAGTKDATTTRCNLFSFPGSQLPNKGVWSAVVSYESNKSKGSSQATTFDAK
jgi:hypothetical protein